jgi:hypothetical protein
MSVEDLGEFTITAGVIRVAASWMHWQSQQRKM